VLGELLSGLGEGVLEIAKVSGPLLLAGVAKKHLTKMPNNLIPVTNGILGVGIGWATTGDPQQGAQLGLAAATGSVGVHQLFKIGARKWLKVQSL
jgi:hypothetical protein